MAMTKKERAEMEAAILRAETLAALRWTGPVARDLPPPSPGGNEAYTQGWDFNAYTLSADEWWSGPVTHGRGRADRRTSASQSGRALFSTQRLALAALRHAVEMKAAADLLKVDRLLASLSPVQQEDQGK